MIVSLNRSKESLETWEQQMDPGDERTIIKKNESQQQQEQEPEEQPDAPSTTTPTAAAAATSRASVLLSKGASAFAGSFAGLWNSLPAAAAAASSLTTTKSQSERNIVKHWHRGDLVPCSMVVSKGGIQVRRVREQSLVFQFVLVTDEFLIFFRKMKEAVVDVEVEEEDPSMMEVLSKYPLRGLIKVASRKKEQLMLILSFSHSIHSDNAGVAKVKKIGFVCENEKIQKNLTETMKRNYNILKGK